MLNMVAELQRHHTKFIILRATDPMDTIFLTRFLRTEYPHGRIVTIDSDLLLRREAEDPRFHGVLSLSTYFLYPTADHYFVSFEEDHVERIFANSRAAGTYNAMRSLMNAWVTDRVEPKKSCRREPCWKRHEIFVHPKGGDLTLGTFDAVADVNSRGWAGERSATQVLAPTQRTLDDRSEELVLSVLPVEQRSPEYPRLYQYGWLGEWQRNGISCRYPRTEYDAPPVRLSALGRDDFWPIAALGSPPNEDSTTLPRVRGQISTRRDRLAKVEVPISWRIMQLAGILLGAGFAFSIWRASVLAKTQTNAKFAPAELDGRAFLVFLAGLTLVLILLILRWPTVEQAELVWYLDHALELTAAAVFLITFVDLVSRTVLAHRPGKRVRFMGRKWSVRAMGWVWPTLLVAFALVLVFQVYWNQPEETLGAVVRFSTIRAVQLNSGLSFIMPTFFFLTVWLWWANHTAAGYALLDHRLPRLPEGMTDRDVQRLSMEAIPGLHAALRLKRLSAIGYAVLLLTVFLVFWTMGSDPHPLLSLERPFLQKTMAVFFTLAVGGVIVATVRLWGIWLGVRKLLVALDALPLRRGFEGIIKGLSWHPVWRIGAGTFDDFQRIVARQREALTCARNTHPLTCPISDPETELNETRARYRDAKKYSFWPGVWWRRREAEVELIRRFGKYQEQLAKVAGCGLDYLAQAWAKQKEERKRSSWEGLAAYLRSTETLGTRARSAAAGSARDDVISSDATDYKQSADHGSDEELSIRAWERLVCLLYVAFLLVMLVRIRTLIVGIGGMYVLTMIAITQYPFQPKTAIQVLLVVLLGYIIVVVGSVLAQLHRDAILSRITGTNPGELGLDFYVRMISFTALPLFSLLAAQFPSVNRFFYSWLQPAIQAFNH